jgi:hypothetical protein
MSYSQVMIVRPVCFVFSSIYTIVLLLWDFWILAAMIDVLLVVLPAGLSTLLSRQHYSQAVLM